MNSIHVFKDLKGMKISTLEPLENSLFIGTKEGKLIKAETSSDSLQPIKVLQEINTEVDTIESIVEDNENIWIAGRSSFIYQFSKNLSLLGKLEGHEDDICKLAFDKASGSLFSSSEDCCVFKWNLVNKSPSKLYSHDSPIIAFDFNANLKTIASSCSELVIIYYSVIQGKVLNQIQSDSKVWSLKIVDSRQILIAGNHEGYLILMHLATLEKITSLPAHESRIKDLSLSKSQKFLYTASFDGTVQCWDLETFREFKKFDVHHDWVRCLKVSRDGKRLYSSADDDFIGIWDLNEGTNDRPKDYKKYLNYFCYICPCYWVLYAVYLVISFLKVYSKSPKIAENLKGLPLFRSFTQQKPDHYSV